MREPVLGRGFWPFVIFTAAMLLLAWLLKPPIYRAVDWAFGVDRDPLYIREEPCEAKPLR